MALKPGDNSSQQRRSSLRDDVVSENNNSSNNYNNNNSNSTTSNVLRRRASFHGGPPQDAVEPERAIQLMLIEMKERAAHAEEVIRELQQEIARFEDEAENWRSMMSRLDTLDREAELDPLTAFLSGISIDKKSRGAVGGTVNQDMANAAQRFGDNEVRLRELRAQEELLTGEIERDRWDKMRMLKLIDIFMMGRSAPTAGETVTFAKFGNAKSEALIRVIRALPVQNIQLLDRQGTFKCIMGVLAAAQQQHRRFGFVDLERVASQGVRWTGQSLGMSVIHGEMSEEDFHRL